MFVNPFIFISICDYQRSSAVPHNKPTKTRGSAIFTRVLVDYFLAIHFKPKLLVFN